MRALGVGLALAVSLVPLGALAQDGEGSVPPVPSGPPVRVPLGISVAALSEPQRALVRKFFEQESGVAVVEVKEGSVGERVGLKPGMVILTFDNEPVLSPEDFCAAVEQKASHRVALRFYELTEDSVTEWSGYVVVPPARSAARPSEGPTPTQPATDLSGADLAEIAAAYLAALDFVRTKALGREIRLDDACRARAAGEVFEWSKQFRGDAAKALAVKPTWAELASAFDALPDERKAKVAQAWRALITVPGQGPWAQRPEMVSRTDDGGLVSLQCPADWTFAVRSYGEQGLVGFVSTEPGPDWMELADPATRPAGVHLLVGPAPGLTAEAVEGQLQRYCEQVLLPGATEMRLLAQLHPSDGAALHCYAGRFPGQSEEKFVWAALALAGKPGWSVLACATGPLSDAATYVPIFEAVIASLSTPAAVQPTQPTALAPLAKTNPVQGGFDLTAYLAALR